jgi:thioredoxin-dependent adenylylsulfate APS reductase
MMPGLMNDHETESAQQVLRWALNSFQRDRIALCTSFQADGVAILDMAWRIDPLVKVFTIDTGRLPQETHEFMDRVRQRYGLEVEVYVPETGALEGFTRRFGANAFLHSTSLRHACCEVRKVQPLGRVLQGLDAWITGLRRDQAPTRASVRKVEADQEHGGLKIKINPLADWSEQDVWTYVRDNNVPHHPLYDRGYQTIGCAPCTRPVQAGESARAGRWWWESDEVPKECGMHYATSAHKLSGA